MRILAIRGENLASLGEPFLLDFEAEPLAGTGLFAITGETGSGKSTILDALCLALYGRYPRFAEQQHDSSPDPGGKVKILDGSTILRRGAGRGYAEVDFLGQDNLRYRARWEARRSREKADGAIQSAARSLHILGSATPTAVATSKTEVQDAIHDRTGLTFEQFCRTVLLAQGDFDSFLLAPERERGDLLEKITGTEIYGRISRRVREGTKALESEVETLESQLTNMGLLNPSEHDALVKALAGLRRDIAEKSAEAAGLQMRLQRVDNLAKARVNLAAADDVLAAARLACEDAAPERDRVAELAAVEPLRPLRGRLDEAAQAMPAAEALAAAAVESLQEATNAATGAGDRLSIAQVERDEAERIFKDFGPQWDEAARLDTVLSHAENEAATAASNLGRTKTAFTTLTDELREIAGQIAKSTADLTNVTTGLAERNHQGLLTDRLEETEALLERHQQLSRDAEEADRKVAAANKKAEELEAATSRLETKLGDDATRLQTSALENESLRKQLEDHDQTSLETEVGHHIELLEELRGAQVLAASHQAASAKLLYTVDELAAAQAAETDAKARLAAAATNLKETNKLRTTLSPLAELAEESLTERTAYLRSRVLPGEACPVCGAREHPYLEPGAVDALSALAAELKAKRDELDRSIVDFNRSAQQAASDEASARGKSADANRQQQEAERELVRTQDAYAECVPGITDLGGRIGLKAPPQTLGERAIERLQELESACRASRTTLMARVTAVRELRTRLDTALRARERAQQEFDHGQRDLQRQRTACQDARIAALALAGETDLAHQQVAGIEDQVRPFLAAVAFSPADLHTDRAAVLKTLDAAAAAVRALRLREAELATRLTELDSARDQKTALHAEAERQQDAARNLHEQRVVDFRVARDSRALLLGGEPTNDHRTRVNESRKAALKSLDEAQKGNSAAALRLVSAEAEAKHAADALASHRVEHAEAEQAYSAACLAAHIALERAGELLDLPPSVAMELRDRLDALERLRHTAEAQREARQNDVDKLRSEEVEAEDQAALALALKTVRDDEATLNQALGEKGGRVEKNLQLRLTAADLERQVQAKAGELVTWQEVDHAIGSPNGDRFRLFAQSLTLEQLIQLANEHLDTFSKRYHLARSPASDLALHVIDRDMGDEERPTRSLSGGERFLVSLSLALALAGLEGSDFFVDTLFIDEGFGSLDVNTLDIATTALETLHSRGRKVGVITHVSAMIESIPVQVKVEALGGGSSVVRLVGARGFAS